MTASTKAPSVDFEVDDYLTDGRRLVEVVEVAPKQMNVRDTVSEYELEIDSAEFKLWRKVDR